MKYSCTKNNIINGLTHPLSITTKSGTLPILSNVKIDVEKKGITISATNLEVGIISTIRGRVEEEGSITVDARLFIEYIRLLPGDKIDVRTEGTTIIVSSQGDEEAVFQGMAADEFPLLPQIKDDVKIVCRANDFREGVEKTVFAASPDEARPEISGVYVNADNNEMTLVATDSYRLSERKVKLVKGGGEHRVILPLRAVQELVKMLPQTDEEVCVVISDAQVGVRTETTQLITRIVEGMFPDYKQIIPKKHTTNITIVREDMVKMFKRSALFSQNEGGELFLRVCPKKATMDITAKNQRVGSQKAQYPIEGEGEEVSTSFNVRFLLDGFTSFTTKKVRMEFVNGGSPVVMRGVGEEQDLYLLMPIRE